MSWGKWSRCAVLQATREAGAQAGAGVRVRGQRDRETERQRDRETERERGRETNVENERQALICANTAEVCKG